jgi:hypothetical protein
VLRRSLLLTAAFAAFALPAAPALAGEDDDSATLHESQSCVSAKRAKAAVTGDGIEAVAFYVDGKLIKTVTRPTAGGAFVLKMRCARLSVGAHRARAVVTFEEGSSQTLRFQITRSRQGRPQFTG